ncbi:RidA family protein [Acetobacteroides hydrogenigenes]|uniref:2-iminobutanoate/2-iminopropanoate deaminase n=1 Tax=Acetobacteroides hydrogenigenes TaxID=979970 RepID=A0A4R2EG99_9BACT|nr:RidA family protein [Acetobacteroides hydrogenigenes]TCN67573.1 2-iminobutanoate/2-iminopropanoate deaminase [Acetobacteroides hydrogenigenes]
MKRIINTENAPKAVGPYSQAVEANGTLYISGQLPIDPATAAFVEGGVKEQTAQALKNIGAILEAAGYNYNDVVKSTVLLNDMNDFAAMNEVYASVYTQDQPARVAYQVAKLPMGALVEIETIAVK